MKNKKNILWIITLVGVFMAGMAIATLTRSGDTVVSGSAPPTPSILRRSDSQTVAKPLPLRPTVPPAPTPTRTPIPPTPTPTPRPQMYTLNVRMPNPDAGNISIYPDSNDGRYEKGTLVSLTATSGTGYRFNGWSGDISGPAASMDVVMDSSKRIQAEFVKLNFPINLSPTSGGTVTLSPANKSFDFGATVTAKAVPDKGYVFKAWTGDASGLQNPATVTVDRAKTIGAQFAKGEYTLNIKTAGTGTVDVSPAGSRFEGGTVVTLTARPAGNYRFVSWSGDITGANRTVTVTMDANKTLTATFVRTYYLNVTISPPGSGSVSVSSGIYDEGAEVTLIATPYPGWQFRDWSGNTSAGGNIITITMNWDKAVMASFEPGQ